MQTENDYTLESHKTTYILPSKANQEEMAIYLLNKQYFIWYSEVVACKATPGGPKNAASGVEKIDCALLPTDAKGKLENGSSCQSFKGFWLIAPEWNTCQLFVFPDKLEALETLRSHSGEDSACARTYIRTFDAQQHHDWLYIFCNEKGIILNRILQSCGGFHALVCFIGQHL